MADVGVYGKVGRKFPAEAAAQERVYFPAARMVAVASAFFFDDIS